MKWQQEQSGGELRNASIERHTTERGRERGKGRGKGKERRPKANVKPSQDKPTQQRIICDSPMKGVDVQVERPRNAAWERGACG